MSSIKYAFSAILNNVSDRSNNHMLLTRLSCLLVPPYGAETANLQTIFDIKHLKKRSYFLNIQCKYALFITYASHADHITPDRLPIPLGAFISQKVYNGKLRSSHSVADNSCIAFIDVCKGEEKKRGSSYKVGN
jgi:hypothetical protein